MRKLSNTISWVFYLSFAIWGILLLTTIWSGFKLYYYYQYNKNDIMNVTKLDSQGIDTAIDRLTGYLSEKYSELNEVVNINGQSRELFNDRELEHMKDVKHLMVIVRRICGVYSVLLLGHYMFIRSVGDPKKFLKKLFQFGFFGVILIVLFLSIFVFVDFTWIFVKFHEVFFTNDLWLLDPSTDVLIQMLPEVFFRDIVIAIFTSALMINFAFYWFGEKKC